MREPKLQRRARGTIAERFEKHVDRSGGPDACHPWTGARRNTGHPYGLIKIGGRAGRYERAHRVAWELKHGPVPDGFVVCHRCDNPPCCNDVHLFLGTQAENLADMRAKGRAVKPPPPRSKRLGPQVAARLLALGGVEVGPPPGPTPPAQGRLFG